MTARALFQGVGVFMLSTALGLEPLSAHWWWFVLGANATLATLPTRSVR